MMSCCGIGEISSILPPPETIDQVSAETHYGFAFKIIVFTDVVYPIRRSPGQKLKRYIVDNNLGEIIASKALMGRSGNKVRLWTWYPDYEALEARLTKT